MSLFSRIVTAIVILLFPFLSIAQNNSQAQIIDHIIEETSIEEQMNRSPEELEAQYSQNPFGLESSQNEQLMECYRNAFETESMLDIVTETFRNKYDTNHADATMSWLNEENTKKVHALEKEFYTIQGIRKRVVHKYELEQNPPDEARKKIIDSLNHATSATVSKIESYTIIFRGIVTAFGQLSNQQFGNAQIETFVQNYRSQIQPQLEQQGTNELMIKYYDLNNNQLKQYASFFDTGAGRWLNSTSTESIHNALEEATDRFLDAVNDL
jgi:stress-induced morphogen